MLAGAGVFLVFAGRALGEIDVKPFGHVVRVGCCFHMEAGRKVVSFRKRLIGNEAVLVLREGYLLGGIALAADCGSGGSLERRGLVIFAQESQ